MRFRSLFYADEFVVLYDGLALVAENIVDERLGNVADAAFFGGHHERTGQDVRVGFDVFLGGFHAVNLRSGHGSVADGLQGDIADGV